MRQLTPWLLAVVGLAACSGTLARLGKVDRTIGRASYHDIMKEVPEVLSRHGYAIYDRNINGGGALYLETGWQERAPFEDEAAAGITYARTRFIVRAREASAATYTLRLSAENEVQVGPDATARVSRRKGTPWGTMAATAMYEAYVRQIASDIEMRVAAGLRTF